MRELATARISKANEDPRRTSAGFYEIGCLPKISVAIVDHARDEGFISLFQPGVVGHRSQRGAAGIRVGDLIVSFGGERVTGVDDLHRMLTGGRIGDGVEVAVLRGSQQLVLRVTPREFAR